MERRSLIFSSLSKPFILFSFEVMANQWVRHANSSLRQSCFACKLFRIWERRPKTKN